MQYYINTSIASTVNERAYSRKEELTFGTGCGGYWVLLK
jgi:hypothetical protein